MISFLSRSATSLARLWIKLLPSLGIFLVTGGFLLLGWIAYVWLNPGPAPYRYQLAGEGPPSKFDKLGLGAWPNLAISKYQVNVEGVDKPIATAHVAKRNGASSVLLNWESHTSELLISTDTNASELATLATAIAKYAPKDAIILSWWDTSRQINLLAERDVLFPSHHSEPLIIPSHWNGRSDTIKKYEQEFWGAPAPAEERRKFQRFADALVAEPKEGGAILRELAGSREAYVVVHITDLYKLGLMRKDRFDMAYKDFPMSGSNMHGLVGTVKRWQKEKNYETYTLQSLSDKAVRVYFLRDAKSSNVLLAQMLPFISSKPVDLEALQLIYQHGSYWVYKIPSTQPSGG